uniref:Uncharacterized protein n=1 Tax=Dromaius novaehollandiae TaxID=8790 RepID=A0A8C4K0V5_DRONO
MRPLVPRPAASLQQRLLHQPGAPPNPGSLNIALKSTTQLTALDLVSSTSLTPPRPGLAKQAQRQMGRSKTRHCYCSTPRGDGATQGRGSRARPLTTTTCAFLLPFLKD